MFAGLSWNWKEREELENNNLCGGNSPPALRTSIHALGVDGWAGLHEVFESRGKEGQMSETDEPACFGFVFVFFFFPSFLSLFFFLLSV